MMKSPPPLDHRHPKNQVDKMRNHIGEEGVPLGGISVNQDQRKVKSEDVDLNVEEHHIPVSMTSENDSSLFRDNDGDSFTEEFTVTVTKHDVSSQSLNDPGPDGQSQRSSSPCSCGEEIESLKVALKRLTLQVNKQNQVITGMKSSLRNAVISLMTCCYEEEEDEDNGLQEDGDHGDVQESLLIGGTSSKTPRQVFEDPLRLGNVDNGHQTPSGSSMSLATAVSHEDRFIVGENMEPEDNEIDDEDIDSDDKDDSSYVPDDNEGESDMDVENDPGNRGTQSKTVSESGQDGKNTTSLNKDGRFDCSKCDKNFKSKNSLREHLRYIHYNRGTVHKCNLCSKDFRRRYDLTQHIKSVHEGARYKCAHCPGIFKYLKSARRHEQTLHVKRALPTLKCQHCSMHFHSKRSLDGHKGRRHSGPAKTNVESLQKKMRTAMVRETFFQCQRCSKSYPDREKLRRHQNKRHGSSQGTQKEIDK